MEGKISTEEYNAKLLDNAAGGNEANALAIPADLASLASAAGYDPSALMGMMAANMATTQDGSLDLDMQAMEALTKAATANSSLGSSLNALNALNENPEVNP